MAKKPKLRDLTDKVFELENNLDSLDTRYKGKVARLFDNFKAQFERDLKKALKGNLSRTEALDLVRAEQIASQLTNTLQRAGYRDLVEDSIGELPRLTKKTLGYFKVLGEEPQIKASDQARLAAMSRFLERDLARMVDRKLLAPLEQGLFDATFGGKSQAAVLDDITALATNLTPGQSATLVSDAFRRYERQVIIEQSKALDIDIFMYVGPEDKRTREACVFMLNYAPHGAPGVLYKNEINASLHPDLEGNVLIVGGGWNCRHKWVGIPLEVAQDMGFKPRKGG